MIITTEHVSKGYEMVKALLDNEPFLQGGPFIELSVVVKAGSRQEFLEHVLAKLSVLPCPSLVNLADAIKRRAQFLEGWIVDEELNTWMHETTVRMMVDISGWRKCQLRITELQPRLYQLDFEFYGDGDDAPEWHQLGVKASDYPLFRECLGKLCLIFNADLGLMGIEVDVSSLFGFSIPDPGFLEAYDRIFAAHVESSKGLETIGFHVGYFDAIYLSGRFLDHRNG
jgi:hypothetical protein